MDTLLKLARGMLVVLAFIFFAIAIPTVLTAFLCRLGLVGSHPENALIVGSILCVVVIVPLIVLAVRAIRLFC